MDNLNVTGIAIGALVVGALTGAVLGVLFAPDKGSKTRSNIVNGAKDMTDDIKKKLTDEAAALRKKAEELEELAKEKIDDITNNVKHKAEEATKA
ncbi:MAG: YtxH domain-containing protein [Bacteroidales bacterium]|nr:YtxH domain-containing protein [Bacteroidales bacterium]